MNEKWQNPQMDWRNTWKYMYFRITSEIHSSKLNVSTAKTRKNDFFCWGNDDTHKKSLLTDQW